MNLNIYRKFVHHSVIITELSRKLHVDYVLQRYIKFVSNLKRQMLHKFNVRMNSRVKTLTNLRQDFNSGA